TVPVVLGGIEASLRRVAQYDFWSDSLRRSILLDAKADYLLYGMAEESVLALAKALRAGEDLYGLRGLCRLAKEPPAGYLELPSYERAADDPLAFIQMFHLFYANQDPLTARGLYQRHGERVLVHNPPALYETHAGLDAVYALPFQRAQHPYYEQMGAVKALETIRFALGTHRGCYGECNYCSIAVHEGRTVRWRSIDSVVGEAERLAGLPGFKGYIQDVGGPTANMYGYECAKKLRGGACSDRRCLYPEVCPALRPDHQAQVEMLRRIRAIPGVKKAFVASGIRYDVVLADRAHGKEYLKEIVGKHVSGQLKVAPEHTEGRVLAGAVC
ncbi:MAG TPA: radical SAM protein, partial [Anaerolinea sp.]|nr:radical SAM protein [Anaerolinea sp.]